MAETEFALDATAGPDLERCLADTRAEAGVVLSTLITERSRLEALRHESGAIDPIAKLTGASALDRAIASTRDIIRDLDSRLIESKAPRLDAAVFEDAARVLRVTVAAEADARFGSRDQTSS